MFAGANCLACMKFRGLPREICGGEGGANGENPSRVRSKNIARGFLNILLIMVN